MRMRWVTTVTMPLLLAVFAGCSTYVDRYFYRPRPGIAEIPPPTSQAAPPVTGLASIIGVRYASKGENLPECIEIRLRLEDNSRDPVVFDPQSLELLDGTLLKFPPPILRPNTPVTLQEHQAVVMSAFFPFPPGHSWRNVDMESLQLRWLVKVGDRTDGLAVNFHRATPIYYTADPYWYGPGPYVGGGFVIVHHHFR